MKSELASIDRGSEAGRSGPYSTTLVASVLLLAALGVIYSAWPIWRACFPLEINVDEPWNAYHADAVIQGLPLYPDPGGLIDNNYPPLSFYVIAGLSRFAIDPLYVGRILSFLALLTAAGSAAYCVRRLGGTRLAAGVGGLWFFATMTRFFDGYIGKNDPHLPALAISIAGLAWLLRLKSRGRALEPAVVLMVIAGFYKHTLIGTPAAALLWLALEERRLALRAAAVGAGSAIAGLLICIAVFGPNFISQLFFFPRTYSLSWAMGSLGRLQWIAPALIFVGVWIWYERGTRAARFSAIYLGTSFLAYYFQEFGAGVGDNAQFELVAATAIGVGLTFDWIAAAPLARLLGPNGCQLILVLVLVIRLLASSRMESYLVLASADYRDLFRQHTEVLWSEVERVRKMPGAVDCSFMTVCRFAGKPFVFDPWAVDQMIKTGKLTPSIRDAMRQAEGIYSVVIDNRASVRSVERGSRL